MNPPRMHFSGDMVAASSASWIRRGDVQLGLMLNQMQFQDLQQYRRVTEFLGVDGVLEGVVECVAYPGMYGDVLSEVYIYVPVPEIAEQIKEEGLANAGGSVIVTMSTGGFMLDQYVFNPFSFAFSPTIYSARHTSDGKVFFHYYNDNNWGGGVEQCSRNYWSSGCDSNTGMLHLTQGSSFSNFCGDCDPIGDNTDCGRAVSTCIYSADPEERVTTDYRTGLLVTNPVLGFDSFLDYWTAFGGFCTNFFAQTRIENTRTDYDLEKEAEDRSWKRYSGIKYRAINCTPYCAYYMLEYAFDHSTRSFTLVGSDYQEDYAEYACEFLDCIDGSPQGYSPYIFNHTTREYEEDLLPPLEEDDYYHNVKTVTREPQHVCFGSCLSGASPAFRCRIACTGEESWVMWVDQDSDPVGSEVGSSIKYPLYPFPFYWSVKDNGSYYDLDLAINNHCIGSTGFWRWKRDEDCSNYSCSQQTLAAGACYAPPAIAYGSWDHKTDVHQCIGRNTVMGTISDYECHDCGRFPIKTTPFCTGCVGLGYPYAPTACIRAVGCSAAGYYSTGITGHRRTTWTPPEHSYGYTTEYEVSNNRYDPYCLTNVHDYYYGGTYTTTNILYTTQEGVDETYDHIMKYSTAGVCGYDEEGIPTIKYVRMFDTFDGDDFTVYILTARPEHPEEIIDTEAVTEKFKRVFAETFGLNFPDAYWRETVVYDDSFAYKKEFQWRL